MPKEHIRLLTDIRKMIEERLDIELTVNGQIWIERQLQKALSNPICDVFTHPKVSQ